MELKKNIEDKYKENILNLSKQELEVYIRKLAKDYYSAFFSNDGLAFERTLTNITLIESIGAGANIKEFVNYCPDCKSWNTLYNATDIKQGEVIALIRCSCGNEYCATCGINQDENKSGLLSQRISKIKIGRAHV